MKIEVGDRVTLKDNSKELMMDECDLELINKNLNKILKIERPNWEVVEEKKELLTEEEREFLNTLVNYYEIRNFEFTNEVLGIFLNNEYIGCIGYPKNMKFEGVERYKRYTPKELRTGGINNGFRRART